MSKTSLLKYFLTLCSLAVTVSAMAAENPFLGEWDLTIPGGGAGWLGVTEKPGGGLQASLLWGSGSVFPLASAKLEGDNLVLERNHELQRADAAGKKSRVKIVETITATLKGDRIELTGVRQDENDPNKKREEHYSGKRQPPIPPVPDLTKVKFGPAINLFNGKDLTGWRLVDPQAVSGWSAKNGLLINNAVQEEGKHKNYGNLRTDREFEDFNLKVEVNVGKDQNSGIYLRGIYEVQVADTYGRPIDPHNMGAVYSRIKPTMAAEKPPGEWQTLDITLVDRHISVELNGKRIIDNQPVMGCTGGALWSDINKPGPIYLQGDHTSVTYRSLVLRPVVK